MESIEEQISTAKTLNLSLIHQHAKITFRNGQWTSDLADQLAKDGWIFGAAGNLYGATELATKQVITASSRLELLAKIGAIFDKEFVGETNKIYGHLLDKKPDETTNTGD